MKLLVDNISANGTTMIQGKLYISSVCANDLDERINEIILSTDCDIVNCFWVQLQYAYFEYHFRQFDADNCRKIFEVSGDSNKLVKLQQRIDQYFTNVVSLQNIYKKGED